MALPPVKLWFNWRFEDLELLPAAGPAIVACNHLSYLDPLANAHAVIRAGRRPRFLAKDELFQIPIVGRALKGAGQIPVSRVSGDQTSLLAAEAALGAGEVVVIYPEGTVTTDPDSMPMRGRTGTVRLSLTSGVPITPMVSWGSHAVWQKSGRGSLKFGRPIWIRVGAPFDVTDLAAEVEDHGAVRAMTDELMAVLTTMVRDLHARYPARWAG